MAENLVMNGLVYNGVDNLSAENENGEKITYTPAPAGSLTITENGTYDVTKYASVVVNISSEGDDSGGTHTPEK